MNINFPLFSQANRNGLQLMGCCAIAAGVAHTVNCLMHRIFKPKPHAEASHFLSILSGCAGAAPAFYLAGRFRLTPIKFESGVEIAAKVLAVWAMLDCALRTIFTTKEKEDTINCISLASFLCVFPTAVGPLVQDRVAIYLTAGFSAFAGSWIGGLLHEAPK
jgi:hypothetical protein